MKEFSGKRFQVETKKVKLPNGHIMRLEKVSSKEIALVLPIVNNDKIAVIKQYRPAIKKWLYEFPAGLIERNETPIKAARRELEEETGLICKNIKKAGGMFTSPGFSNEFMHIFLADCTVGGKQNLEPAENIIVRLIPAKKIIYMVKKGMFVNGPALSAILFGLIYRKDLPLK
ncbi:MAG: NUDIX hydrolase [Candidatus Parvarchaeota archaeon]|jgi:ADP-ribose pyrophosphatase|nr:NUDIX hydrolase [Candidatus Parvarchaeota archaeon]MCW1295523.1 NUDIX hydrolase [Candidatus Parvarchaeum tengchongense]MCW1298799.1 NUDIX hydrolase [Candidatus Parvarchaeum tengchongense]MCW1312849.1 NUDIX hydrolase [Candidatus Parvarchaeum tengchongense]